MAYYIHMKSPAFPNIETIDKVATKAMALVLLREYRETAWTPEKFWVSNKKVGV